MAKVDDVAAAILARAGAMDTWKLEKLVYYCQAWHLVWDDEPLFPDRIEAWANGPVVPYLYEQHRGMYRLGEWRGGAPQNLAQNELETVQAMLDAYGDKTGQWLSALTHNEQPWKDAREGLTEGERGNHEITKQAMLEYYGSLT